MSKHDNKLKELKTYENELSQVLEKYDIDEQLEQIFYFKYADLTIIKSRPQPNQYT